MTTCIAMGGRDLKEPIIKKGRLFIISAPSGAGKTTIANTVIGKIGHEFPLSKVITYTSRSPRKGEVQGQDYCFLSKKDFSERRDEGFFLETTEYNGQWYGSPQSIISDLDDGKSFIIITDINGAKSIAERIHQAVLIWLAPPSHEVLRKRLTNRGTESSDEIEKRIALSREEMDQVSNDNFFEYHVINDSFDLASHELCQIIRAKIIEANKA